MRIYIAAPLTASADREERANVARAFDAGLRLIEKGHAVYIPHLDYYMQKRPSCKIRDHEWLDHDFKWLEMCDAMLFLGHSSGADEELAQATLLSMEIYYSIESVPSAREESA